VGTLHPDGANDKDGAITQDGVNSQDGANNEDEVVKITGQPGPEDPEVAEDLAGHDMLTAEALTTRRRKALTEARRNGLPAKVESWRKRSATGAVLTGFALGFREALGLEPEKAAIVMEAQGDPPSDLPVDAEVDQIRPADNVVRIRPWLLANGLPADESREGDEGAVSDDPAPVGTPDGQLDTGAEDGEHSAALVPERRFAAMRRRGRR
jgi:hypothetical protein